MNIKDFDKRIVFQSRAGRDAIGGLLQSWSPVATAWAKFVGVKGEAQFAAQAERSAVTHEITVRYQTALSVPAAVAAMRIVYGGRYFDIQSAINIGERNEWIVMRATEGRSDG